MKSFLVDDTQDRRAEAHERKFIGIDANVDLPMTSRSPSSAPGELFGEMTCRTFQPRSATVITREPCVMVEMLRVILDMLVGNRQVSEATKATSKVKMPTFKGTSFKAEMDEEISRALARTLICAASRFSPASGTSSSSYLKEKVELVSYNQNQVICKEGEEADAFYLIRSGMVRVSQCDAGRRNGPHLSEPRRLFRRDRIAALDQADRDLHGAGCGRRGERSRAPNSNLMLEKFPAVRAQLEPVAEARMAATKSRVIPPGLQLDDFLNQGLFEAQNLLLIDLDNCTRCDACVQACAKAHDGVSRLLRDGLRYDHFLVATACRSCRDPLCMTQCPVGSIRRKENLEIIIEDWCIGCGKCAELCPYGNINMHPLEVTKEVKTEVKSANPNIPPTVKIEKKKSTTYKANTCDLCTQLSVPSCVYACPHDAAKRVDPQRFFGDALEAQNALLKDQWSPTRQYETHHTH